MNKEFIKSQFNEIKSIYELKWTKFEDEWVCLENDKIEIEILKDRFEDGLIANIVHKLSGEFFTPIDLMQIKGFNKMADFLTPDELDRKNSLDADDVIIFVFRILMEKHVSEMLSGNFTPYPPGRKTIRGMQK
ncbi:MAG: hypothetical protein H6581_14720 [Bacteroidia bacterium]|nr:hypothetical protein [Bacteroidia bacterium]